MIQAECAEQHDGSKMITKSVWSSRLDPAANSNHNFQFFPTGLALFAGAVPRYRDHDPRLGSTVSYGRRFGGYRTKSQSPRRRALDRFHIVLTYTLGFWVISARRWLRDPPSRSQARPLLSALYAVIV